MKENLNWSKLKRKKKPVNKGTLFVCATPIGNLQDVSFRLLETLKQVDIIAAEDTRVAKKLLSKFDIHKPLISIQKYNEADRVSQMLDLLNDNKNIALISDAGTPNICDPGSFLINQIRAQEITIVPIPGPSSLTTLLSVSGLLSDQFYFAGFFPKKTTEAKTLIQTHIKNTIVFFDSPKRIVKTIDYLVTNFSIKEIAIAKELTKIYEHIWRDPAQFITDIQEDPSRTKGEWVIQVKFTEPKNDEDAWVLKLKAQGLTTKQIIYIGKHFFNGSRNNIYKLCETKDDDS